MKEREPEWYGEARKGPFQATGFTEAAADRVIKRVRSHSRGLEQPGLRMRFIILPAVIILLLAGTGAFLQHKGLLGEGRLAGFFYQEGKTPDLSDAGIRKTAERMMLEQLGKKLPFESLERVKETNQAAVMFRAAEDSAAIWISTVTGEVLRVNMNAALRPGEIEADAIRNAKKKMREIGYQGDFKITRVQRFVQYGLTSDAGVQVQDSLAGDEGQIDFVNGEYSRAVFHVSPDEISEEVSLIGRAALKQLRTKGTDNLSRVTRQLAEDGDELILTYRQDPISSYYSMGTVTLDYATHAVIGLSDLALYIPKSGDAAQLAEQDRKLLNMDNAKLQSTAAAVIDDIFGIRLQEYRLVKDQKTPGIVTYESEEDASAIKVSYNLEGVVYNVRRSTAP